MKFVAASEVTLEKEKKKRKEKRKRKRKREKETWLFIYAHNITPTLWLVSVGPSIACAQFSFNFGIPCLRGALIRTTNEVPKVCYSQPLFLERDCRVDDVMQRDETSCAFEL